MASGLVRLWGKDGGAVMLILGSLVKKSTFKEISFHRDLTDKIEPSRIPGSVNVGKRLIDSYKACNLV